MNDWMRLLRGVNNAAITRVETTIEGGPTEEEVEEKVWREVIYLEGIALPNPFRKD